MPVRNRLPKAGNDHSVSDTGRMTAGRYRFRTIFMKIGVDIRCLQGGRRSGVEEYTTEILKHLLRLDHRNEYVLFLNSYGNPSVDMDWAKEFPNVRVRRFRVPNKFLNLCVWYAGIPKIDRLLGGVDMLFAPNMNFLSCRRGTKLVLTMHDLSFDLFPETFSWKMRLWHMFVNPRRLCMESARIVAVSNSTAEDIRVCWRIPEAKIRTVHSGLRSDFRPMGRNDRRLLEVKEKYRLPYRFVLFLGTLEPRKNVATLIRAYEIFRSEAGGNSSQYKLVIAGQEGWKSADITRALESSPYRDDILRIGPVGEQEKIALYNLASVFVYPSLYEGFGFPVLEAMGCGTPVIASDTASLPEVSGKGAILVNPIKPREIASAIREVVEDETLSQMMRDLGTKNAARFSWEAAARETLGIFEELASDRQ